jgi:site-specific DNA recombinase
VKLISAKEDFGDGLMAEAMEAVTDVFNWRQVRMSGEDIKVKMANKARNGGTVGRAKVGYLNVQKRIKGREVRTIETDAERAPLIVMTFEQFATGKYTIESLRVVLTQAGLRMAATAKRPARPISLAQLGEVLPRLRRVRGHRVPGQARGAY